MAGKSHVVIGGAGTVGRHIAQLLREDEYDVALIDQDAETLREFGESIDIQTIHGNATSPEALERAGVENAALMLALTNSDEVNLLSAFAAKQMGATKTVARARSPWCLDTDLLDFRMRLHIDLVLNPEHLTALEMTKFLTNPDTLALADFAGGKVQLRQFTLDEESGFADKPLADCDIPEGVLVVARAADNAVEIPRGPTVLRAGDRLTIVGQAERIPAAQRLFRLPATNGRRRKVFIAGGGHTGLFLAQNLGEKNFDVKLLEVDKERCNFLSERLHGPRVVHGDATQVGLLEEEGATNADVFVATTDNDETNLLTCLLAKDLGAKQTLSKVIRPDYAPLVGRLGVDLAVSPRMVMADRILAMVRGGKITSVSLLEGGSIEVVEFVAQEGSALVDRPLSEAPIPKDVLVAAIVRRGGAAKVPRGSDKILPGDTVIVVGLEAAIDAIEKALAGVT